MVLIKIYAVKIVTNNYIIILFINKYKSFRNYELSNTKYK